MKDYWNELTLSQKWDKKERFNFIMDYIDSKSSDDPTPEPTPVDNKGTINVTVIDEEEKPVNNADVSVYDKGEPFEATTGTDGKCQIVDVPYGDYTIEAVAEGFDFTVDSITVNDSVLSKTLILKVE